MSINTGLAKKKKTQQRNGRSVTGKTKEKKNNQETKPERSNNEKVCLKTKRQRE